MSFHIKHHLWPLVTVFHIGILQVFVCLFDLVFILFYFLNKKFKKIFWLCWVFIAVHGLLIAVASLAVEHRLSAHGLQ